MQTLPTFVSLIVMLLHHDVDSYCCQTFPSLSLLSNYSLILECLATGCRWMASWTGVTFGSKSKERGLPNCPNPLCTSGNAEAGVQRCVLMRNVQHPSCWYWFWGPRYVPCVQVLKCWQLFWWLRVGFLECCIAT